MYNKIMTSIRSHNGSEDLPEVKVLLADTLRSVQPFKDMFSQTITGPLVKPVMLKEAKLSSFF